MEKPNLPLTRPFTTFLTDYPLKWFKKGQTLLFQGEVPRHVYIIKKGAVKVYNIDSAGEEKIINIIAPDEIVAPSWVFGKAPVALYYYDVLADTQAYMLSRSEFATLIRSNPKALYAAFDKLSSVFTGAIIHINALEESKSARKLISLFNYLIVRFGKTRPGGTVFIDLRLTQHDIARMLGLTRETVAVELSRLKKQGVVSHQAQHYVVNSDKLQRIGGEEEFSKVTI